MGTFEDNLNDVKTNIRAVMSTSKHDFNYQTLRKEYEEMVCQPMPLCGFKTTIELLNSIPDVIQVIPGCPDTLRLVASRKSQHVVKLVREQKSSTVNNKSFPSPRTLSALGIRLPAQNTYHKNTSTLNMPMKEEKTNIKYKWPPVSELLMGGPKINVSAHNEENNPESKNNSSKQTEELNLSGSPNDQKQENEFILEKEGIKKNENGKPASNKSGSSSTCGRKVKKEYPNDINALFFDLN